MKPACCVPGALPRPARPAPLLCLVLTLTLGAAPLPAQLVTYSFGPSSTPTTAPTFLDPQLNGSAFSGLSGSPATGSSSPVYAAGSGGSYFTASTWTGAAPGANYFEFTLTPAVGYEFSVTGASFGYRATSSGPIAFALRSSADGFAADLASGTFVADSTWYASGTVPVSLAGLDSATTFRLYGSGASSSLGTLRVDDFTLTGGATAVPEPSTWATLLGAAALAAAAWRRRTRSASFP